MARFFSSSDQADPYTRPTFGLGHRLVRLLWRLVWLIAFRPTPRPFHPWRAMLLRLFGAKIGRENFIYSSAQIWAPWLLKTGDVVTIADHTEIYNPGGVVLHHHAIISQGAFLCGATHDYNDPAFPMIWEEIEIAAYGWVCARAVVLPGVKIGEGAVLGAAAVAGRNLLPWGVYAGNPAKLVAQRNPAVAQAVDSHAG